jgi:hypothetical protein
MKISKGKFLWSIVFFIFVQTNLIAQESSSGNSENSSWIYKCNQVDSNIRITGKIDDPNWEEASIINLSNAVTGKPGSYTTKARMLYNANYLYIAIECEDEFIWGKYGGRDSNIFEEECVEVFICPSGKIRQYYEIDVSPHNVVFDAFILNGKPLSGGWSGFRSWKDFTCDGMETKVYINGELGKQGAKGWSVEYAIPFSSITGSDNLLPVPGEEWRINLYRIDSPEKGKQEFYAWSPTGAVDFHRGWKFGVLKFAGK